MIHSALLARADLAKAAAICARVVDKRSSIPVLENVLIRTAGDAVEVIGTDLDLWATVTLPNTLADDGFATLLSPDKLAKLCKSAPACDEVALDYVMISIPPKPPAPVEEGEAVEVEVEAEGPPQWVAAESTRLTFGALHVAMQTRPIADFPEAMALGDAVADFELPTHVLRDALAAVEFAISTEETRYYLNGVALLVKPENGNGPRVLQFVATDGHRLAVREVAAPAGVLALPIDRLPPTIIIPAKSVAFLLRMASAKDAPTVTRVTINPCKAMFTLGNVRIMSKMIDGTFPDFERVIPRGNEKRLTIDVAPLAGAVKALQGLSDVRGRAVRLDMETNENRVTVSMSDADFGTASQAIDSCCWHAGCDFETGINGRYLLDILDLIEGPTAEVLFGDPGSPILFHAPGNDRDIMVLMPMRI
jgi:DNA polymerase-3 subunit beta